MKFKYLLIILPAVLFAAVGVVFLRNYQMDRGIAAWKMEQGSTAVKHLHLLAIFGDSKAQYFLGEIYAYGSGDVQKDDAQAVYWFRRAATDVTNESDPAAPAELEVAKTYVGIYNGVPIDKAESLKWLRFAAAGGSKEAAALLAKMQPTQ